MSRNYFSIEEGEMDNTKLQLKQAYDKLEEAVGNMTNKLSNMQSCGLFDFSPLSNNIQKISNSIINTRDKVNKSTASIFETETALANAAESIEVPRDFIKDSTFDNNKVEDIDLSKEDGKGINSNNETSQVEVASGNSIDSEENLGNIVAEDTEMVNEISDNSVDEENLEDITKEDTEMVNEIADNSIEEELLKNIKNEETEMTEEIADNSIEEKELDDILNEETKMTEDIADSSIKERNLGNIMNQEAHINDKMSESTIDEEKLTDIKKSETEEVELEVDDTKEEEKLGKLKGEEQSQSELKENYNFEKSDSLNGFNYNSNNSNSNDDNFTYSGSNNDEKKEKEEETDDSLNFYSMLEDYQRRQQENEQNKKDNEE